MNNFIISSILFIFIIIILFSLYFSFYKKKLGEFTYFYFANSLAILLGLICEFLLTTVNDDKFLVFLFNTKFSLVGLVSITYFLFVLKFYRHKNLITPQLIFSLIIIPIGTFSLNLFLFLRGNPIVDVTIVQKIPFKIFDIKFGPWFWMNTMTYNIIFLITIVVIFISHFKILKGYRGSSFLILLGFILVSVVNIAKNAYKIPLDVDLLAMAVNTTIIYMAIVSNSTIDFLVVARNDIFNYLQEMIFILDKKKNIIDFNKSAADWLIDINFKIGSKNNFDEIIEFLKEKNADIVQDPENEKLFDIHFYNKEDYIFYSMEMQYILDDENKLLGYFVYFNDITKYKLMINRLEYKAGIDPLTGVGNRSVYENYKFEIDKPENYPIGIIIGDVNGLKKVNDTYGHLNGDELLKEISTILKNNCPFNGVLCRIGGDEFAIILRNSSEAEIKGVINNITIALEKSESKIYKPSISLGYALKTNKKEDLEMLIYEADIDMYKNKTNDRRRN